MQLSLHFRPPLTFLSRALKRESTDFVRFFGAEVTKWTSRLSTQFVDNKSHNDLQCRSFSSFSTKSRKTALFSKDKINAEGILPHWNRDVDGAASFEENKPQEYDERNYRDDFFARDGAKGRLQEKEDRFDAPIRLTYDKSFVENDWETEWLSREQLLKRSFLRETGHWRGLITMPTGDTMQGEWKDGLLVGSGTLSIKKGAKYEGGYDADRQRWKGKITFKNGNTQEGEWINGRPHGTLIATTTGGTVFEGVCTGDHSWTGRISHISGQTYEGEFWHGYRHGQGTLIGASGYSYTGSWKMGQRHGTGNLVLPEGRGVYEGDFRHDLRHGYGVSRTPLGFYEGQWENGHMQGMGKRVKEEGTVYEGEFRASRKHGRGRIIYKDGSRFEGHFVNDARVGKGTFVHVNGDEYTGMWRANMKDGVGTIRYPDGSRLSGLFRRGAPYNASGTMITPKGTIYEGTWVEGRREGEGRIIYKNGEFIEGEFKDNMPWNATGTFHPQYEVDRLHGVWKEGEFVEDFGQTSSRAGRKPTRL